MKISILMPTRKRPQRLKLILDNIAASCDDISNIELLFLADEDDTETISELYALKQKFIINCDKNIIFSNMWNILYPEATGELIMIAGDDIEFKTTGWDTTIRAVFAEHKDKFILVGTDDGIQHQNIAVHPFIHRRWVNTLGYVLPPYFKYWYADNWLTDVAKAVGRFIYLPNIMIQHVHGITGRDETYIKNEGFINEARQVWNSTANLRDQDIQKILSAIQEYPK